MTDSNCSIAGCDKKLLVVKARLCQHHYHRKRKYGDPLLGLFDIRESTAVMSSPTLHDNRLPEAAVIAKRNELFTHNLKDRQGVTVA